MTPDSESPKTPFFSLRNVPFWMGLALALVVASIIIWRI